MKKKPLNNVLELWPQWIDAVKGGDLGVLGRLSARDPRLIDALGEAPPWTGQFRAIHYAAFHRRQNVVRWLLAHGASAAPMTWSCTFTASSGGACRKIRAWVPTTGPHR